MKKIIVYLILSCAVGNHVMTAQVTAIPDVRFEQALINLGIDSDNSINGQILTADALAVSNLVIAPMWDGGYIEDLTGIEVFVNLDSLTVNSTMIDQIDVSTLIGLKYLNLSDNMLTTLDVSNNVLLEDLHIPSVGDLLPINAFTSIDLSNNPDIKVLGANGIGKINLKNHNPNIPIVISTSCVWCWAPPGTFIVDTCILVDNPIAAQNNEFPYSTWNILEGQFMTYHFAENDEQCSLGINIPLVDNGIQFQPNPVTSGVIHLLHQNSHIQRIVIFDFLGRLVLEKVPDSDRVDVSTLRQGNYLMKIFTDASIESKKIIIK